MTRILLLISLFYPTTYLGQIRTKYFEVASSEKYAGDGVIPNQLGYKIFIRKPNFKDGRISFQNTWVKENAEVNKVFVSHYFDENEWDSTSVGILMHFHNVTRAKSLNYGFPDVEFIALSLQIQALQRKCYYTI